jgi:hypothetical protein
MKYCGATLSHAVAIAGEGDAFGKDVIRPREVSRRGKHLSAGSVEAPDQTVMTHRKQGLAVDAGNRTSCARRPWFDDITRKE